MDDCHTLFQHSGLHCEGPETAHVLLNGSPFTGVSLLSLGACDSAGPLACTALPHRTSSWGRRLLLHLLLSLGLVSVILLINYPIFASITGAPITRFWLFRFLYVNLDRWLLIYWVILMISHAFNYYNNYRKGELKASDSVRNSSNRSWKP